jgi:hypothetical protein
MGPHLENSQKFSISARFLWSLYMVAKKDYVLGKENCVIDKADYVVNKKNCEVGNDDDMW